MMENKAPSSLMELIAQLKAAGVQEKDHFRAVERYLEFQARAKAVPLHGHFELTPFCNLDCKMCYVHLDKCQDRKQKLLPADFWKGFMGQAHKMGMLYASLTGGECLTYPGFDEIYRYLWEMGVKTTILSNGILMDEDRIGFLKRYPPYRMQVTLYGSSEDAYEKVTGHRAFATVYRNLEAMRDAELPVVLAITPNEFMVDDAHALLECAESTGIPYNINSHLIPPRENTGRTAKDLAVEQYIDIFKNRNKLQHLDVSAGDVNDLPDENHGGEERYGVLCGAGRSSFGVRYDGLMCPCLSLYDSTANLIELGFAEAWKTVNHIANTYPMPSECKGCAYSGSCTICPVVHKNAPIGHCDPRVCERTKALIRAGLLSKPKGKPD